MKQVEFSPQTIAEIYNHKSPDLFVNPYPIFERLRAFGPRAPHPVFGWLVTDHSLASAVFKDTRLSASRLDSFLRDLSDEDRPKADKLMKWLNDWILFQDAPTHTANRGLMVKSFTPAIVETLRGKVERIVSHLCDEMAKKPTFDLIKDFAYPLPAIVIAELLGLPAEDKDKMKFWSDEVTIFLASPVRSLALVERATKAVDGWNNYLAPFVEDRRKNPREDLITKMVQAVDNGMKLTDEQIYAACAMILFAGHETTTYLISNGMLATSERPSVWAQLKANPQIIPSAVEEFLRFDGPVQMLSRVVQTPVTIDGQFFEPGLVAILLGAANRDPKRFDRPNELILDRQDNKHVGFGVGHHFCLGAKLARLEVEIALRALIERFPNMKVAKQVLTYQPTHALRALKSLMIERE